jgi:hypothetical protein
MRTGTESEVMGWNVQDVEVSKLTEMQISV